MRRFMLGVLTGFVVVALGLVALVLTLPGADVLPPARTAPLPGAPSTVAPGETWLPDVHLTSTAVLTSTGPLRDVVARGRAVRLDANRLVAGELELQAVLPYATAARQVGTGVQLFDAGRGRAGLRRDVIVLGRRLSVTATGTVRAEGGLLVIEPQTVDLGGPGFLDTVLSTAVRRLVTVRHRVNGVPAGLRLTAVTATPDGFSATLAGRDVVLTS